MKSISPEWDHFVPDERGLVMTVGWSYQVDLVVILNGVKDLV